MRNRPLPAISTLPDLLRGSVVTVPLATVLVVSGVAAEDEISLLSNGTTLATTLAAALVTALAIFGQIAGSRGIRERTGDLRNVLAHFGMTVRLAFAIDLLLIVARAAFGQLRNVSPTLGEVAFIVCASGLGWLVAAVLHVVGDLTKATQEVLSGEEHGHVVEMPELLSDLRAALCEGDREEGGTA